MENLDQFKKLEQTVRTFWKKTFEFHKFCHLFGRATHCALLENITRIIYRKWCGCLREFVFISETKEMTSYTSSASESQKMTHMGLEPMPATIYKWMSVSGSMACLEGAFKRFGLHTKNVCFYCFPLILNEEHNFNALWNPAMHHRAQERPWPSAPHYPTGDHYWWVLISSPLVFCYLLDITFSTSPHWSNSVFEHVAAWPHCTT